MYFELPNTIINAISWTVIHSIWQISIIALVMSVMLQHTPTEKAHKRYFIGLGALASATIVCAITFAIYLFANSYHDIQPLQTIFLSDVTIESQASATGWIDSLYMFLSDNSPLITQLWLIGVIAFGVKFILGFFYVQYLNFNAGLIANSTLENTLKKVMTKMNVAGSVVIAETRKVATPIVTGHIKPIILFPLGMLNQLDLEEVEIIITHELAHIIRNDWIINIIQSIIEIIFYYHPGIWWISSHIREERENSCDDLALQHGYNHVAYAKLLVKLKEVQLQNTPSLALSFFNSKNKLMNRIKRLLGQPLNRNTIKEKAIALVLIFTVAIAFAGTKLNKEEITVPFLKSESSYFIEDEIINIAPPTNKFIYQDTIPEKKKRSAFTLKNSDGKSYNIESENGEITNLEIDGKVIPKEEYDKYIDEIDRGKDWDFNFDGDSRFGIFQFDSFPSFSFNLDHQLGEEWEEGLKRLSERLGEIDWGRLEDLELREWHDGEEFEKQMEELQKRLEELDFGNMEHLKGLERLHELEELEHMKGLEGLERLKELEGLGEIFENFNFDYNFPELEFDMNRSFGGNTNDKLASELNEDGLIKVGENNEIELTGKHLKINGEKQPSNIWQKYKGIFEKSTGMILSKDSKVKFDIIGKESRSGIRRI